MKDLVRQLKSCDPSHYLDIPVDKLILFATVELDTMGIALSLQNIIVAAFHLFPLSFSLQGFPEYPDATRVEKALWRCKGPRKRRIGGKTAHGYEITDVTRAIAREVESLLKEPRQRLKRPASRLRRGDALLREVTSSPAYIKYTTGQQTMVTESEMCQVLQGTMDSSDDILRGNLTSLREFMSSLENCEIVRFLDWLKERFSTRLSRP